MEFSKLSMRKIIRSQGDKRISEKSTGKLGEVLDRFAGDVAEEAIAVARENGRKTVRAEDIKQALK